ncbi:hypothetical protein T4D_8003 [Trichinella pseudospiralis]|uniref:Uncharacterized protein n=1 Tax=Trichinella pseudospiralis TaxID=6337 RepID=A0A0V1FYF5_TRIPS|nr:hypothetical protein T4D_8003 [Trichinella pseudospiralis]
MPNTRPKRLENCWKKRPTRYNGDLTGNRYSTLLVAVQPTCWRPPVLFSRVVSSPRFQWTVAALNHTDSLIQVRLTARLGDDVDD